MTETKKSIWTKWWMICIYVFVGFTFFGVLFSDKGVGQDINIVKTPTNSQINMIKNEISFKLMVWDDTEQKNAKDLEIWVKGLGSWYPNLEYGGDSNVIGPFPVEEIQKIFIYPDGRNGKEIMVEFIPKKEMISQSDRDAIIIEISDEKVIVSGIAIKNSGKEINRN